MYVSCYESVHTASECYRTEMMCFYCGHRGHRAVVCPYHQRIVDTPVFAPAPQFKVQTVVCVGCHQPGQSVSECYRADMICFSCGARGHNTFYCPQRHRPVVTLVFAPAPVLVPISTSRLPFAPRVSVSPQLPIEAIPPRVRIVRCILYHKIGHDANECFCLHMICYVCGGRGHRAVSCPNDQRDAPVHPSSTRRSSVPP